MTDILTKLLAFTRYGAGDHGPLCIRCMDADLRAELGSLSHAADIEQLQRKDDLR